MSHIAPDGHVFIQMLGPGLQTLEHLTVVVTEEIEKTGSSLFVAKPVADLLVLARYVNGGWYRAQILAVDEKSRKVSQQLLMSQYSPIIFLTHRHSIEDIRYTGPVSRCISIYSL